MGRVVHLHVRQHGLQTPQSGKDLCLGPADCLFVYPVDATVHLWDNFGMWVTETSARMEDRFLPWIYSAFQLVIAIVFYVLTYRKIKTQKY
jgi:hypothetical protein